MNNIKDLIGEAALLEQLAEEASELTQAALKAARILRGDNPTPVTLAQARDSITEEFTDVIQVSMELRLSPDDAQIQTKTKRWIGRIKEATIESLKGVK
jgi:NTP pyrophosphatase (non-canonical NTP hydrolase)